MVAQDDEHEILVAVVLHERDQGIRLYSMDWPYAARTV